MSAAEGAMVWADACNAQEAISDHCCATERCPLVLVTTALVATQAGMRTSRLASWEDSAGLVSVCCSKVG